MEDDVSEIFNNKRKGGENDSVEKLADTDKESEAEIEEKCDSISDGNDDGLNHNENKHDIPSPTNSTNFSITEILKPSFGCKTKEKLSAVNPHHTILLNEFHRHLHNNYDFLDKLSILNQYYVNSVITKDFLNDTTGRSVSPDSISDSETASNSVETKCSAVVKLPVSETRCTTTPWPAWVYCTRYSDRPSAGPRSRKSRRKDSRNDEKRPRTAFTNEQLVRLKSEFESCRYLTEQRRQELSKTLNLSESQIKIWFQNKRAKIKKSSDGVRSPLALHLMAQGLYNHVTASAKQKTKEMS